MLTVDKARSLMAEHVSPLLPVRYRLRDVIGLTIAQDVMSDIDSPPHNKAMMDGFAVIASDRSQQRTIIEEVMAGDVPRRAITPGCATRVMTGAPVPEGATAVVPVEKTQMVDAHTVRLEWVDPPVGKHILRQGASMRIGQQVVSAGTVMRPIEVAILAEVGCAALQVVPRPRVTVLATGNELVHIEQRPAGGQIRNSNGPMLTAAATSAGASTHELPIGRDDLRELTALATQGLDADVLLVTGGVSAGAKDLVPEALVAAGVAQVFHKVALKPGKPIWFGVVPRPPLPPKLVFGLPGNPVSALVCFHVFVKPALAVLAGRAGELALPLETGTLAGDFDHRGGRETFRPARFDPAAGGSGPQVHLFDWHGSADLCSLARANCLLHLPAEPRPLHAGEPVEYLPLDAV